MWREKLRKKKALLLAGLALAMALGVSVKGSLAYFTTYATASGGQPVALGWKTQMHESYENGSKTIVVENIGELECYVRVRVFAGDMVDLQYSGSGKWEDGGDGYWYYKDIVAAGAETESLVASITYTSDQKADYDVVVVQECAPVLYDEDGKALPCTDQTVWSQTIERSGEGA